VGFTHLLILYLLTLAYFYFVYTWLAGLSIFFLFYFTSYFTSPRLRKMSTGQLNSFLGPWSWKIRCWDLFSRILRWGLLHGEALVSQYRGAVLVTVVYLTLLILRLLPVDLLIRRLFQCL
jgi:hypothetical protein